MKAIIIYFYFLLLAGILYVNINNSNKLDIINKRLDIIHAQFDFKVHGE